MSSAERLARDLMIRMKEIDPSKGDPQDEVPGYEHYGLLWDAMRCRASPILDEVRTHCPELDYAAVLEGRVTPK